MIQYFTIRKAEILYSISSIFPSMKRRLEDMIKMMKMVINIRFITIKMGQKEEYILTVQRVDPSLIVGQIL